MRNPEHGAVAFLYALDGRAIGQVIIDEWFGVDLGEEVTVEPREGGLFGLEQFEKPIVAGSAVVPRIGSPWMFRSINAKTGQLAFC